MHCLCLLNLACVCKGGDKLTLSLSCVEEDKVEVDENSSKEGPARSPTPVTVTHFSWGEAGKLEQRVVSPSLSPSPRSPTPFMSLSLTQPESLTFTNPFKNPFDSEAKPTTNPFLNHSNPFLAPNQLNGDLINKPDENNKENNKEVINGDAPKILSSPKQTKEILISPLLKSPSVGRHHDKSNGMEQQKKISDGKLAPENTLTQLSPWLVPSEPLMSLSATAKSKQDPTVITRKTVITTQL
uniref:Uncharacterized protein n=1 Tax=Clastoptera arizonana TaxID=38151 RepID=A0A1B6DLE8_9HEMI